MTAAAVAATAAVADMVDEIGASVKMGGDDRIVEGTNHKSASLQITNPLRWPNPR